MRIVIFTHPTFMSSQSMPRFVRMLVEGLTQRGHQVETLSAKARLVRLAGKRAGLRKWLGYLDQFVLFPIEFLLRLRRFDPSTLFVFSDQALGPWVPMVAHRPHVIHCHDFLALRSAHGEWPQNPTGWTGRRYQALIRWGFDRGQNFLSVSYATRDDLRRFMTRTPRLSAVVHNALNYPFGPMPQASRTAALQGLAGCVPEYGFLLHVGGNQWYKNRPGVLAIYQRYALAVASPLPLWMIGEPPSAELCAAAQAMTRGEVHFISNATDAQIQAAYCHARVLLFPSIAEGFGWPIAEAMACGCAVITSDTAPMTEVGGAAAIYIPTPQSQPGDDWATRACEVLIESLAASPEQIEARRQKGFEQASSFAAASVIGTYETWYRQILIGDAAITPAAVTAE